MKRNHLVLIGLGIAAVTGGTVAVNQTTANENAVQRIAEAIGYAEGYNVNGSRPRRNNNPGNITADFGQATIGQDGPFPVFATAADGWEALKRQIRLMLNNHSSIYNSDMTIYEMAQRYTATEQDIWARNVAQRLGVSTNTPLHQIV